ncbi:MAG: nitrous oxide reductase family maturation protein NosD [Owenweeksia sp.]|nr:nitrous oxide reductase family maturation protein NosD [Owenweeksia sp.]
MIKNLVVIIIVVGWSVAAYSNEIVVGPSQAVTSFSQAVAQARPFDTICIQTGQYHPQEAIVIDKPLSIIACGQVVVSAAPDRGLLEVRADSVTITGLHLKNVGRSYTKDLAAIWVDYARYFKLSENRITDCFFAIFCTKAGNGQILNNKITGNAVQEHSSANAIHAWYCDSLQISGNLVEHHRDGIYLEFTDHSSITKNQSRHNLRYGLHFMFSNHDEYLQNSFTDNGAGVAVMFSDHISMRHNIFNENWGSAAYGLLLKEIYDSDIRFNTFRRNTVGIFAEGSNRVLFESNVFRDNGWALKMRGSSMDNDITGNNFIGNSFHVATDAGSNENRYHANYWDDYSGYDLNHDGKGDVPYRPVNLFHI